MSLKPAKKGDIGKAWLLRGQVKKPYSRSKKSVNKTFLIVCEGENTEVQYFQSIPVVSLNVIPVHGKSLKGEGKKLGLVKYALELAKESDFAGAEVWCVFDYDIEREEAHVQPQDFDNAVALASKKLHVAWSNDCFELWFLLHYQYIDTALERGEYYTRLKNYWGLGSFSREAKTKSFCQNIFTLLQERGNSEQAIQRAERLDKMHESNNSPYHQRCPCSTVYKLVRELTKQQL